jgi:hypothetical protein
VHHFLIIIIIIKVSMSQALPCPARLWTLQKPSMAPHIAARSKHILNSLEYVVPWQFHTCILLFLYIIWKLIKIYNITILAKMARESWGK